MRNEEFVNPINALPTYSRRIVVLNATTTRIRTEIRKNNMIVLFCENRFANEAAINPDNSAPMP
ncbi:hypothetical protein D3C72_2469720 [compost metagenome]